MAYHDLSASQQISSSLDHNQGIPLQVLEYRRMLHLYTTDLVYGFDILLQNRFSITANDD